MAFCDLLAFLVTHVYNYIYLVISYVENKYTNPTLGNKDGGRGRGIYDSLHHDFVTKGATVLFDLTCLPKLLHKLM